MYDTIRRKYFKIKRSFTKLILNKLFGMFLVIVIPTSIMVAFVYYYPFIEIYTNKVISGEIFRSSDLDGEVIASTTSVYPLTDPNAEKEQKTAFSDFLTPMLGDPVKLKIEDIGIELKLIEVGVTDDKVMESPKDWNVGGWYKNSSKAGETGNIIINAHYDDNYGRPAAFWNLKKIEVGDKVQLVDSYGRVYNYLVDEFFHLDIDDPDRLDILKMTEDRTELTLITCGGFWVPGKGTYSQRLVVKAKISENPHTM